MDFKTIINNINSKFSAREYFETKVYDDEPIIKIASQMNNYLPEQYKAFKKIAAEPDANKKSSAQIFYEQAKFMEDFADDYLSAEEFYCFFPTYCAMSDKQLRTYFSWRTGVRNGVAEEISVSYVYLYIYELLSLIGAKDPLNAYNKILNFYKAYRVIDTRLDAYLPTWLKDFIIYYNLDKNLLNGVCDMAIENSVLIIVNNEQNESKYFNALETLSSFNLSASSFYKHNPLEFAEAAIQVFKSIYNYYEKKRQGSFAEKLFGRKIECSYNIFSSAVFYDSRRYDDYTYEFSPIHKYRCRNGIWSCERYYGNIKNNKEIGCILKYVDFLMRSITDFRYQLKDEDISCTNKQLIKKIVFDFLNQKEKSKVPVINVDSSKLNEIRNNANTIMEKLIVEEEEEVVENAQIETECLLNGYETKFLICLLTNSDYTVFLREQNMILSVVIDGINEKLFEQFADNIICFEDERPQIFEEYIEELKGMFL